MNVIDYLIVVCEGLESDRSRLSGVRPGLYERIECLLGRDRVIEYLRMLVRMIDLYKMTEEKGLMERGKRMVDSRYEGRSLGTEGTNY